MSAPTPTLHDCLLHETAEVAQFTELLEAEAAALDDGLTPEQLQSLTDRKTASAQRLQELANRRDALLAGLGLPGGHDGTDRAAAADAQVGQAWARLLEASDRARQLNARNGALIDTHLRHTRRSLDILREIAGISNVYDAKGRSHSIQSGKKIAAT